jgi:GTP 3',8-cyclase
MKIRLPQMNFGALKEQTDPGENVVYYRRGLDELSLNITNACPNACGFCIRDRDLGWGVSNLYLSKDPSSEEIKQAYDKEVSRIEGEGIQLRKVKICGYGEPILRFDEILETSDYIISRPGRPPNIQVTTTGWPYFKYVFSTPDRIPELRDSGVTHIYLSMNAIDSRTYEKLVKPGIEEIDHEAFQNAIRFGLAAQNAGLDVTMGFIRLKGLTDESVQKFSERIGLKFKLREFEQ